MTSARTKICPVCRRMLGHDNRMPAIATYGYGRTRVMVCHDCMDAWGALNILGALYVDTIMRYEAHLFESWRVAGSLSYDDAGDA